MDPVASPAGAAELRVLVQLRRDGAPLLLPAGLVPQVLVDPVISPIPGCRPWFPGILARRGEIVPVFDIAAEWGDAPSAGEGRYAIVIESASAPFAFRCAVLPDVTAVSDPIDPPAGMPLPGPARYLSDWRRVGARIVPELDVLRWLRDATPAVLR